MGIELRQSLVIGLTACSLWLIPSVGEASISVAQSIDRTEMAFEDTAAFRVTVAWDGPAYAYRFEKAFRLNSDKLKVARYSSSVRSAGSGPTEVTTKVFEYQLAPVLSGVATIQPMILEYVTWPDSLVGELNTDPVSLAVAEPIPAELKDKGGLSGGWLALVAVGVIGAAVGAFAFFKPKPRTEKIKSPAEAFLEQLDTVRKDAGMDLKKFQTGVYRSLIVYIQARYALDLTGQSAESTAQQLAAAESDQSVREALSGWLIRAEKEKFSPLAPAPGEVSRLEAEIRVFFDKLK
ncbi:MAG: hypothetical protein NTW07_12750 [candidate division Zixibacteria bacterium]|nr:hypothetical protein [candidate division Zixibacteria bacterium]